MTMGTAGGFDYPKGLGFIRPDDSGKAVFVHLGAVECAGCKAPPA